MQSYIPIDVLPHIISYCDIESRISKISLLSLEWYSFAFNSIIEETINKGRELISFLSNYNSQIISLSTQQAFDDDTLSKSITSLQPLIKHVRKNRCYYLTYV
jgi:hypothetical protein